MIWRCHVFGRREERGKEKGEFCCSFFLDLALIVPFSLSLLSLSFQTQKKKKKKKTYPLDLVLVVLVPLEVERHPLGLVEDLPGPHGVEHRERRAVGLCRRRGRRSGRGRRRRRRHPRRRRCRRRPRRRRSKRRPSQVLQHRHQRPPDVRLGPGLLVDHLERALPVRGRVGRPDRQHVVRPQRKHHGEVAVVRRLQEPLEVVEHVRRDARDQSRVRVEVGGAGPVDVEPEPHGVGALGGHVVEGAGEHRAELVGAVRQRRSAKGQEADVSHVVSQEEARAPEGPHGQLGDVVEAGGGGESRGEEEKEGGRGEEEEEERRRREEEAEQRGGGGG